MIEANKQIILKNGLRILFIKDRNAKVDALGIAVNAGPYFEDEGKEGISHLIEHTIGRLKNSELTFREKVYEKEGIIDASTTVFQTFYHLYTNPEKLLENAKLMVDGIFHSKFDNASLGFSKESVISEIAFSEEFSSYEVLRSMMWKDPRLSRSIVGSKDSLLGVTLEEVKKYHKYFYTSQNSSVVVIGPSFPDELLTVLEKIPANDKFVLPTVDVSLKKPSYRIFQERNLHSMIALSFPTKGFVGLGEERHLFNITATALSDIYIASLGSSGLVYEGNWNWNIYPQTGDFVIFLESLESDHVVSALKKGLEIVSSWPEFPLSPEKFDLVKKHIILNLQIGVSLTEALPLFTRNFSSSEIAHTYDEAEKVYRKADIKSTFDTVKKVILSEKPYSVVNLGTDSLESLGKINQIFYNLYDK